MKQKISKQRELPTVDQLKKLFVQSNEEVCSLRRVFKRRINDDDYTGLFIVASLTRISELSISISRLTINNMESIYILLRSLMEVIVDLLWVYSILEENPNDAEKLAKRFFQYSYEKFKNISVNYEELYETDRFLLKIKDDYFSQKKKTKVLGLINLVDENANSQLKRLQGNNWRALPGYVKSSRDIEFRSRSAKAKIIAEKIFNLKDAPYQKNWHVLNMFTHWNSVRMKFHDEKIANAFYLRNLNMTLGFLHDSLNVAYHYLQIPVPEAVRMMRSQFIYESL